MPQTFYVREGGFQFCHNVETEYYSDKRDNQKMLSKRVEYVDYEMLCDLRKIKTYDQLKKYLES